MTHARRRRDVALLATLAVVSAVAACAEAPTAGAGDRSRTEATSPASGGVLQGHLYGVGGMAPGTRRAWAGTVTVTGGAIVRDLAVGADGAYSVALPPGRYTLIGRSPSYGSGTGLCRAEQDAQITAGTTITLDTYCSMR
jgi:hypothetical protein